MVYVQTVEELLAKQRQIEDQRLQELLAKQVLQLRHEVSVQLEEQRLYNVDRFDGIETQLAALTAASSSSTSSQHTHCSAVSASSQLSRCSQFSADATAGDASRDHPAWTADAPDWSQPSALNGGEHAQITSPEVLLRSNAESAKICLLCRLPFQHARCTLAYPPQDCAHWIIS